MPWWGWIVVGVVLLGAELVGVDAAFYLLFVGFAAVLTGLLELSGAGLPVWLQWLTFALLAVSGMVLFRKRLYTRFRGVGVDYKEGLAGDIIPLTESLPPGASARMSYRGTTWTVLNSGSTTLAAGSHARVNRVDGLTLVVEANDPAT